MSRLRLAISVLTGMAILFGPTTVLANENEASVEKTYLQLSVDKALEIAVDIGEDMCNHKCKMPSKWLHMVPGPEKRLAIQYWPDNTHPAQIEINVSGAQGGGVVVSAHVGRVNAFWKRPKDAPGIARQFFDELDARVTSYRFARATDSVAHGQLSTLRKSLVGRNVAAKIVLPVLLKPDGEVEFLPTNRLVKPNEVATVTDVMFCSDYPVLAQTNCGRDYEFGRRVVIVLLNNGQLRLAPTSADKSKSDKWLDFSDTLNTLICQLGNALDCVQANQRKQLNQMERQQTNAAFAYAETERARLERANLEVAGPEIIFVIPASKETSATGETAQGPLVPDLQAQILRELGRVVNFLE